LLWCGLGVEVVVVLVVGWWLGGIVLVVVGYGSYYVWVRV